MSLNMLRLSNKQFRQAYRLILESQLKPKSAGKSASSIAATRSCFNRLSSNGAFYGLTRPASVPLKKLFETCPSELLDHGPESATKQSPETFQKDLQSFISRFFERHGSKFINWLRQIIYSRSHGGGEGNLIYANNQQHGNGGSDGTGSGPGGNRNQSELPGDNPDGNPNNQWNQLIPFIILASLYFFSSSPSDPVPETSWQIFYREMLATGEVEKLDVSSTREKVYVYLHKGAVVNGKEVFGYGPHYQFTVGNMDRFEEQMRQTQNELGVNPRDHIPVKYRPDNQLMSTFISVAMTIGLFALIGYFIFFRGRGAGGGLGQGMGGNPFSNYNKAKATIVEPGTRRGIGFKDVAGMQEAKQEVMEFVDFLQYPARFVQLGAKIPKGALLVGPPGTGKTLLAKAVATEAGVPFLSMAGSDFVEMFAGVGAARVRDLFSQARKRAPCIVYIDEIDAIGKKRRSSSAAQGNSEQESTLNQLLVEMDGMNTEGGIVMLASTNRVDILDNALLRPGRFDRQISIDLPTLPERQSIFEIYLKKLRLGQSLDRYSKRLAELTPGKSGADIQNVCNEAALHAARLNDKYVDEKNFEYAIERIIAGIEKRSGTMSPEERRTVAYHEAGHAIVGWMLQHTDPILKISIVPRTSSPLGFTQKFPLDIKLHSNEQLFDIMCAYLGGRVAEQKTFNRITTGAEDDLRQVTNMAYQQIVTFGMNERVGPVSFPMKRKGEIGRKPYSDKLARMIDEEASSMVKKAHIMADKLISDNADKLETLAEALLEREVVNHDDIVKLIGQSPFGDKRKIVYDAQAKQEEVKQSTIFDDINPSGV